MHAVHKLYCTGRDDWEKLIVSDRLGRLSQHFPPLTEKLFSLYFPPKCYYLPHSFINTVCDLCVKSLKAELCRGVKVGELDYGAKDAGQ